MKPKVMLEKMGIKVTCVEDMNEEGEGLIVKCPSH